MNNKKEITYTLDDISKVLNDVLDTIELNEVIKRFKRLKYDKDTEVSNETKEFLNVKKKNSYYHDIMEKYIKESFPPLPF